MNWKDHWAAVIVPIAIAALICGFTMGYQSRSARVDTLEAQMKALQLSGDLQLPKLLADLRSASNALATDLTAARRLAELQLAHEELAAVHVVLKNELAIARASAAKNQAIIDSYYEVSGAFQLVRGETKIIGPYELLIGLSSDNTDSVQIVVNNEKVTLPAGGSKVVIVGGHEYLIYLERSGWPYGSASFRFIVKPTTRPSYSTAPTTYPTTAAPTSSSAGQ